MATFKQYREKDGRFYFKLVDAQGQVLLQSLGFDSPREAGQTVHSLQQGTAPLDWAQLQRVTLALDASGQTAVENALQNIKVFAQQGTA